MMIAVFLLLAANLIRISTADDQTAIAGPYGNSSEKLFMVETFETDPFESGSWFKTVDQKYKDQQVMVVPANKPAPGYESDKGVQLSKDFKFYGFGKQFDYPLKFGKGKDLFIQYELKLEESLKCGGAYIKLPRAQLSLSAPEKKDFQHNPNDSQMVLVESEDEKVPEGALKNFNSDTPYSIMFGPDKCGANNRIHVIIPYLNPISGEWEEKHFNETIPVKTDDSTHLYTLGLRKDSSFEVYVDGVLATTGSLLTHMVPSINPSKEIDDPSDEKPADWVDIPDIIDPNAVKPDDWDETEPKNVPDPKASKPTDWDENTPMDIPDPEATKPEDWDDEEDGEWEAPLVPNPICDTIGCGLWTAPTIPNPKYKGKWQPPVIPNPAYKGIWTPKQIPNENYFYHANPIDYIVASAGIVLELWTTDAAMLFDNFVISYDKNALNAFTTATFKQKHQAESSQEKDLEKEEKKRHREAMKQQGGAKEYLEATVMEAIDYLRENPTILASSVAVVVLTFLYLVLFGGKDPNIEKELAAAARAADAARLSSSTSSPPLIPDPAENNADE